MSIYSKNFKIFFFSLLFFCTTFVLADVENEITNKIIFNSDDVIDLYFESNEANSGKDGLSLENAYIMDEISFISSELGTIIRFEDTTRYVIFEDCSFIEETQTSFEQTTDIFIIDNSSNIIIRNCNFINRADFDSSDSSNIILQENYFDKGFITFRDSFNITISSNLLDIDNQNIANMQDYFSSRYGGIQLTTIENSTIFNNTIYDKDVGLLVQNVTNSIIEDNSLIRCKYKTYTNISDTNTVNGGKYYYYENESNLTSVNFTDASQIYIKGCSNSTIIGVDVEYLLEGIQIILSDNITLVDCNVFFPIRLGIKIDSCSDIEIIDNCIFGWAKDYKDWSKRSSDALFRNAPIGLFMTAWAGSYNSTIARNVIVGCDTGIFISEFILINSPPTYFQVLFNVDIFDNMFSDNHANGFSKSEFVETPTDGSIKWNNNTHGNFWSDYEKPRSYADLPSASASSSSSLTWDEPYEVNGIIDNKPLKEYSHPFEYPDFTPLFPWSTVSTAWIITGAIFGGVLLIAIAGYVLKHKKRVVE